MLVLSAGDMQDSGGDTKDLTDRIVNANRIRQR